jgi:hypothetical protein
MRYFKYKMPRSVAEMNKRSCWLLPLDVPIMDVTDRIGSKVNAVPDVKVAGVCVTVAVVSKVNAEACVELAEACVELPVYDEVVPIPCVGFAVGDDKLPESNVRLK